MSFPRYPEYKDSGVEWLGEVPGHWEVRRVGGLFKEVNEAGNESLPILCVSIHDGVSDRELGEAEMDRKVTRSEDRSKYKRVLPGDLVYNMMRAWQGGFGAVSVEGMVSPAYVVARPTENVSTALVEQLLRTPNAVEEMRRYSRGVTDFRLRLYWEEFKGLSLVLPPPAEQTAIAAFLDRETAKIDALVAEQRRLIELLKEKRQAVISHAVTKGLHPDAPMKDSGIEWLGEVPAHWEVGPVKQFLSSLDGRRIPLSTEERSYLQGEFPYFGASGIIDHVDNYLFDEDLVLVSEDGANLLMRSTPVAFVARGKYWVNNHAHILKPPDKNRVFWAERIETLDLSPVISGAAQPKLTAAALNNLKIAVPPTEAERAEIEAHIVGETSRLENLTTEAQRAIDLLQERRTALISAAITGQIDVRGLESTTAA